MPVIGSSRTPESSRTTESDIGSSEAVDFAGLNNVLTALLCFRFEPAPFTIPHR